MQSPPTGWAPRGILFDLDGTLAHTIPDLAAALGDTMHTLGLPRPDAATVQGWIGQGTEVLIQRALSHCLGRPPNDTEQDRGLSILYEVYTAQNGRLSKPYPGVDNTLRALSRADVACACVTNKRARFTHPLLQQFGWDTLFDTVVCGDVEPRKPHPAMLLEAATILSLPPAALLMVGDSDNDILSAGRARMVSAAVTYGYHQRASAADLGADLLIDSLERLLELFPSLTSGPCG